jgi:hypothetical protein
MLRLLAIAAMFALALPTLAAAEDEHHKPGPPHPGPGPSGPPHRCLGPGGPGGPPPGVTGSQHRNVLPGGAMRGPHPGPAVGGPLPGAMGGPHPGGGQFSFRGRTFNGVHAAPFVYPQGYGYRRWGVGASLPPFFLAPDYFYPEWAALGLEPPPPGTQWVRYGPDLLLVDVNTGQVIDVAYGVFY